jgi:hypothetical protein
MKQSETHGILNTGYILERRDENPRRDYTRRGSCICRGLHLPEKCEGVNGSPEEEIYMHEIMKCGGYEGMGLVNKWVGGCEV